MKTKADRTAAQRPPPILRGRLPTLNAARRGIVEDADAELLNALRCGEPEAFRTLVQRHEHRMLCTAMKITGNREDAEDAVQNTFVQVHKHIDGFRGECQFTSWLTRIVINQSLMVLRRRKTSNISIDNCTDRKTIAVLRNLRAPCPTPEESLLQKELSERLIGTLRRLRLPNRNVAQLHYFEQLSTDEIAVAIGISVTAVKSRLLRSRIELRRVGLRNLGMSS